MAYVNAAYVDLGKVWGFDKKTRNQQGFYDNAWVWGDSAPEGESSLPCSYFYVLGQKDNLGFTPTTIDFDVRTGLLSVQGTQEGVDRVFMRNYMVGAPAPRFLNVRQSQRSRRPADLPVVAIITDDDESLPNIKEYLGLIEEVAEAETDDDYEHDCMNCGEGIENERDALKMGHELLCYSCQHEYTDDELDEALKSYEAEQFDAENDPDFDPEKADRNKDGKISDWERAVGNAVAKSMREQKEEKSAEDWNYYDEGNGGFSTVMNARRGTGFYGDVIVSAFGYNEEEGREIEKEVVALSLFLNEKIKEWFADRSNRASNFTWSGRKGNRTLKKISQEAEEFGYATESFDAESKFNGKIIWDWDAQMLVDMNYEYIPKNLIPQADTEQIVSKCEKYLREYGIYELATMDNSDQLEDLEISLGTVLITLYWELDWDSLKIERTPYSSEELGADTADVDFDEAYMERQDAERIMRLLRTVKRKATGSNARYAKTYADAAEMAYYDYGFKGLKTQVAYVLSNLGGWRGDEAKKVKAELRKLIK